MKKVGFILLLTLVSACAHQPVARTTASSSMLYFECAVAKDSSSGIRITVPAADFNDISRDVPAAIEILSKGRVVEKASNALLGERMPPTRADGEFQTFWALNANLGRSGKVYMGYDPVNPSWSIIANTMNFNTGPKGVPADCKVSDSSGMAH